MLFKKLRFIDAGSCNSSCHQRFMRGKFFKNEISDNVSRNSWPCSERLDLLSVERYELKIDLDAFVDEFDSDDETDF